MEENTRSTEPLRFSTANSSDEDRYVAFPPNNYVSYYHIKTFQDSDISTIPLRMVFPHLYSLINRIFCCKKVDQTSTQDEIWENLPSLIRARHEEEFLDTYLKLNDIKVKDTVRSTNSRVFLKPDLNELYHIKAKLKRPFELLGLGVVQIFRLKRFLLLVFLAMTIMMTLIGIAYYKNSPD